MGIHRLMSFLEPCQMSVQRGPQCPGTRFTGRERDIVGGDTIRAPYNWRERERESEIVGGDNNRTPCNLREREIYNCLRRHYPRSIRLERERYCWRRHHPRTIQLEREILLEETPSALHTTGERKFSDNGRLIYARVTQKCCHETERRATEEKR